MDPKRLFRIGSDLPKKVPFPARPGTVAHNVSEQRNLTHFSVEGQGIIFLIHYCTNGKV